MTTWLNVVNPVARSVAEALLNGLWQGATLAILVWCLVRSACRMNAATRYLVWWTTLVLGVMIAAGGACSRVSAVLAEPISQAAQAAQALKPPVEPEIDEEEDQDQNGEPDVDSDMDEDQDQDLDQDLEDQDQDQDIDEDQDQDLDQDLEDQDQDQDMEEDLDQDADQDQDPDEPVADLQMPRAQAALRAVAQQTNGRKERNARSSTSDLRRSAWNSGYAAVACVGI